MPRTATFSVGTVYRTPSFAADTIAVHDALGLQDYGGFTHQMRRAAVGSPTNSAQPGGSEAARTGQRCAESSQVSVPSLLHECSPIAPIEARAQSAGHLGDLGWTGPDVSLSRW
jgi:hypothetical protein